MSEQVSKDDKPSGLLEVLRKFFDLQKRRASTYALWHKGFAEYVKTNSDDGFNKLCSQVTSEFSDCSRQVKDIISRMRDNLGREDLASVLEKVQIQESQKLRMTSVLQVLRKAGRPSERERIAESSHEHPGRLHGICSTVTHAGSEGLEMAQLEAEFDAAVKEATGSVQDAVLQINDHMEELRYEIEELETSEAEGIPTLRS